MHVESEAYALSFLCFVSFLDVFSAALVVLGTAAMELCLALALGF